MSHALFLSVELGQQSLLPEARALFFCGEALLLKPGPLGFELQLPSPLCFFSLKPQPFELCKPLAFGPFLLFASSLFFEGGEVCEALSFAIELSLPELVLFLLDAFFFTGLGLNFLDFPLDLDASGGPWSDVLDDEKLGDSLPYLRKFHLADAVLDVSSMRADADAEPAAVCKPGRGFRLVEAGRDCVGVRSEAGLGGILVEVSTTIFGLDGILNCLLWYCLLYCSYKLR